MYFRFCFLDVSIWVLIIRDQSIEEACYAYICHLRCFLIKRNILSEGRLFEGSLRSGFALQLALNFITIPLEPGETLWAFSGGGGGGIVTFG